jgi:hypothetical protein
MVGPLFFVAVFIILDIVHPEYNWLKTAVSEHSIGSEGWIQVVSFIITGALLIIFSCGLIEVFGEKLVSKLGSRLLTILGICVLASGPFITDPAPITIFSTSSTWYGNVHAILGAIVFTLMPLTCFLFYRFFRTNLKRRIFARWSLLATIIILIGIVLLKIEQERFVAQNEILVFVGLIQRIILIIYFSWVFSLAWLI